MQNHQNIKTSAADSSIEVSLIIPVFNEADTVNLFLDRVSQVFDSQTAVHLEIIFVNDGSTDGTLIRSC